MKRAAVAQALERLERARDAVERIKTASNPKENGRAWSEFLLAANTVFAKLEQGAKVNGKSAAWYGRIRHLRRTDELLRYIHHARHADEHALESSVQMAAPQLEWVADDYVVPEERRGNEFVTRVPGGRSFKTTLHRDQLVAVKDQRTGVTFDLPYTHMGKPLKGGRIWELGALVCDTIASIVQEAKAMICD